MANLVSIVARVPLAPVIGVMFGCSAAALIAATPPDLFETATRAISLAMLSGLPRVVSVLAGFVVIALVVATLVALAERLVTRTHQTADEAPAELPVAIIDQPRAGGRRRPISADRELGPPLMSDAALTTVATGAEAVQSPVAEEPTNPPVEAPAAAVVADDELLLETPVADALENENKRAEPLPALAAARADPATADAIAEATPVPPPASNEIDILAAVRESMVPPAQSSIDALIQRLEAGLASRGNGDTPTDPPPASRPAPDAAQHRWMVREEPAVAAEDSAPAPSRLRALGAR